MVVTGGVENQKYVYAYGPSSYLYSLPYLLNGRYAHGCGQFVNNDENIVSYPSFCVAGVYKHLPINIFMRQKIDY